MKCLFLFVIACLHTLLNQQKWSVVGSLSAGLIELLSQEYKIKKFSSSFKAVYPFTFKAKFSLASAENASTN